MGTTSAIPFTTGSNPIPSPSPNGAFKFCRERLPCTDSRPGLSSSSGSIDELKDVIGVSVRKEVLGVVQAVVGMLPPLEELLDVRLPAE